MNEATVTATRRLVSKLGLSLILGGLLAWLVSRGGVPLIPPRHAFAAVAWWTIPAYVVLMLITHFFRASRWRFLIAPIRQLPLKDVVALNWVGFFAIFALPLRIGELARPALTKLRHGIPISAGLGTVAVERILDGLVASLCVAWALVTLPHLSTTRDPVSQNLSFYGYLSLAVFAGALVALGVFLWKREGTVRLIRSTLGAFSPRIGEFVAAKVDGLAAGIRSLAEPRLGVGFLFETMLYWFLNALSMWLLAWGCGLTITFGHSVALMGILAIGILLPAGPGLFGSFQFALSTALRLYLPEQILATQGAVFIFLLYIIQAVLITVAGIVPLYAMHMRLRDLVRMPPVSERPPAP